MHDPTLLITILRDDTMAKSKTTKPQPHTHKIVGSMPIAGNPHRTYETCECGAARIVHFEAGERTNGAWL